MKENKTKANIPIEVVHGLRIQANQARTPEARLVKTDTLNVVEAIFSHLQEKPSRT